jgi:hypothetical protein
MGKRKEYTILIYVVFALYLINRGFNFIAMPQIILDYEKWIFLIIGLLLLWGGYRSMKLKKKETEWGGSDF